jgi:hypothetical protein
MGTGEVGPATAAIQNLTRKAAEEAAGLQNAEAHRRIPPTEDVEPQAVGVTELRGGLGWPYGTSPIGRPSYDETEDTPEQGQ